jgi:K+-transporting ATPase ATPase A chain
MEGKEVRFSLLGSTLYSAISTASSNGSTSSIISSYLPLGGMGCLVNILMGQTLFGGLGSGLHSVIIVVIISQYLSSLISGKSLEYLKKKLDVFDIKMIIIANFAYIAVILAFTSFAIAFPWGREAILTPGPHGFTEIVYLFSSVADSNGSSLIGPSTNTDTYHMMISLTILISRLGILSVILALSGSIARKKLLQTTQATIPIHGMTFCIVLIVIMMILGAMSFLPALFIGPILENLMMYQGSLF